MAAQLAAKVAAEMDSQIDKVLIVTNVCFWRRRTFTLRPLNGKSWVVICRAVFRPLAASQFQDAMTALVVCERQ
jgi:hypothetical protein